MLAMELYAMNRLMLVWPMAAKAPRNIDSTDTAHTICCHCGVAEGKPVRMARRNNAIAAAFGAMENSAVMGVGAPSYTSGVHMWNGTADTLNARPAMRNTRPKMIPMPTPEALTTSATAVNPVVPVKP